jgi:hypothetical protein
VDEDGIYAIGSGGAYMVKSARFRKWPLQLQIRRLRAVPMAWSMEFTGSKAAASRRTPRGGNMARLFTAAAAALP